VIDKVTTNAIIAALRKLWLWRGENRKQALREAAIALKQGRLRVAHVCQQCGKVMSGKDEKGRCLFEVDHEIGVRSPPWDINNPDWGLFIGRLFYGDCEVLCKLCHKNKKKTHEK
jgi:hypothetical protein